MQLCVILFDLLLSSPSLSLSHTKGMRGRTEEEEEEEGLVYCVYTVYIKRIDFESNRTLFPQARVNLHVHVSTVNSLYGRASQTSY